MQLVKKFLAFHGTRRFITALTSVRHLSLSWASPIQSIYYSNPRHNYLHFPFSYCRFLQVVVLIITLKVRTHTHYYLLMKCEFRVTVLTVRILWSFCQPEQEEEIVGRNYGYLSTNSEICMSRTPKTINCNTWRSTSLCNLHQNTPTDAD